MTEFKVGDKVKRISGSYNRMCVGDLDIIRYVNSSTSMDLKHHGNGHMPESFELVIDKENKTKFKIGDMVKIISINFEVSGSLQKKDIGKVCKITSAGEDITTYLLNDNEFGANFPQNSLELVTDKEKTKMTEKDIKKFDKKALGEAVKDIDEERLDQQKDKAKDILREIYSRKDTTEESKEKVSEELKGINKELNDFTKASK